MLLTSSFTKVTGLCGLVFWLFFPDWDIAFVFLVYEKIVLGKTFLIMTC